MRDLQKPGHKSCAGHVAAMVTGEPFQAVVDFTGHSGQEHGFSHEEIFRYLLDRGYCYGAELSFVSFDLDAEPTRPRQPCHVSTAMIDIMSALGRTENTHLRALFDDVICSFIAEHEIDLSAATEDAPEVDIMKGVKGIDGYELNRKIRRVRHVQGNVSINQPGIITALVNNGKHALYWDGQRLFDPHFPHEVELANYVILEWCPVRKLGFTEPLK